MERARLFGMVTALSFLTCNGALEERAGCFRDSELIFVNEPVYPEQAVDKCLTRNASLAVPKNDLEQELILSLTRDFVPIPSLWVGKFCWCQLCS